MSRSLEEMKLFYSLQTKDDLDSMGQNILDLLKECGDRIVKTNDQMLLKLVKKASALLESSHYLPIIQVQFYKFFLFTIRYEY